MKECKTIDELKDLVVLEQLVNSLPEEVRVWVKERKPKTSMEAAELADDYAQARKQSLRGQSGPGSRRNERPQPSSSRCEKCGKPGHQTRDRWSSSRQSTQDRSRGVTNQQQSRPKRDLKDIECFNCHKKGHYSANCPSNALFCTGQQINRKRTRVSESKKNGVTKSGIIEGKPVNDILLDTGCSRTLIHKQHVPKEKMLEGEAVAIQCAHGDTVLYPLAQVKIKIDGKSFEVQAAVADRLPLAMLLGTDVPILPKLLDGELLGATQPKKIVDALVITRARAKQQKAEEEIIEQRELESGVQPNAVEPIESEDVMTEEQDWMKELDEELFVGGHEKTKLTRSQKRENRKKFQPRQD